LFEDRLAREARAEGTGVHRPVDLGREDDGVAGGELLDGAADDLLRGAGAVDVGGVPEGDAEIERLAEDRLRGVLVQRLGHHLAGVPKLMPPSAIRLTFSPEAPRFV
jgi:hypothetical protein